MVRNPGKEAALTKEAVLTTTERNALANEIMRKIGHVSELDQIEVLALALAAICRCGDTDQDADRRIKAAKQILQWQFDQIPADGVRKEYKQ
jgi:hypothetical protein